MKIGNQLILLNGAEFTIEDFGVGSFTATPSYLLGVNNSGKAVEVDLSTFITDVPTLDEVLAAGNTSTTTIDIDGVIKSETHIVENSSGQTLAFFGANANGGLLKLSNGINAGFLASGKGNTPIIGAYFGGYLDVKGFGNVATLGDNANDVNLARFNFATETLEINGNTAIGTATASAKLHVVSDSEGVATIERNAGSGTVKLNIFSNTVADTGNGSIVFSDTTSESGQIEYEHANDSMRFYTNATEKVRIDASGNVGIGTTSPGTELHIVGNGTLAKLEGSATAALSLEASNTGKSTIFFADTDDADVGALIYDHSINGLKIRVVGQDRHYFGTNVGIGTFSTSPVAKLHVVGGGSTIFSAENNTGNEVFKISNTGNFTSSLSGTQSGFNMFGDSGYYMNFFPHRNSGDTARKGYFGFTGSANNWYIVNTSSDGGFYFRVNETDDALTIASSGAVALGQYSSGAFDDSTYDKILVLKGSTIKTIDSSSILTDIPTLQEVTDEGNVTTNAITLNRGTGTQSLILNHDTANNLSFNHYSAYSTLRDNTLSSNRMLFHNTGEIAINYALGINLSGANKPSAKLHVVGDILVEDDVLTIDYAAKESKDLIKVHAGDVSNAFELKTNAAGDTSFSMKDFNGSIGAFLNSRGDSYFNGGNVGIGTSSPIAKLSVVDANSNLEIEDWGTIGFENEDLEGLSMGYNAEDNYAWLYSRERGVSSRGLRLNGSIFVKGYNNNVGIGTTSPDNKLHLVDSSATYVAKFVGSNSSYITVGDSSKVGDSGYNSVNDHGQMFLGIGSDGVVGLSATSGSTEMKFSTGGTEAIRINSSRNVGIGTTNPTSKLHVISKAGIDALVLENTSEQIFKVGLNVGDIKTGDSQIFYQGALADNYLGNMDSFNGFRLGRFKGIGTLNQAFIQHHLIANLPSSDQNIYAAQLAFETTGGAVPNGGFKFRNASNGTWSDWYTVYHSGNLPPASASTLQEVTDLGNTTTNNLVLNSAVNNTASISINNANGNETFAFYNAGTPSYGQLRVSNNGSEKIRLNANGTTFINSRTIIGDPTDVTSTHELVVRGASPVLHFLDNGETDTYEGASIGFDGASTMYYDVRSGSHQHIFALGGVNTMILNHNGLGMNTSPSASLHVVGNGNTSSTFAFQVENSDGDDILYIRDDGLAQFHKAIKIVSEMPYLQLSDTTASSNHYLTSNNANLRIQSTGEIEIRPTQVEVARFTDKGLGINGTSNSSKLYVKGDGVLSTNLLIEDADGGIGFIVYDNHEVGIGTNVTASVLHIKEDNDFVFSNAGITLEQAGSGDAVMQYVISDTARWITGIDNSDGDKFKIAQNTNLGADTRLTIIDGGNVGIGTSSPSAKLHVLGESAEGSLDVFHFQNSDNTDYFTMNNAGRIELRTANAIPFTINRPNGNGVLQFRNDANEGSITYYGNSEARYGTGVIQNGSNFEYHVSYTDTDTPDLPSMTSRMVLKETGQLKLNAYTSIVSFPGTAVANLAVKDNGEVITTMMANTALIRVEITFDSNGEFTLSLNSATFANTFTLESTAAEFLVIDSFIAANQVVLKLYDHTGTAVANATRHVHYTYSL